ncbi:hypothetical protein [uncultured Roseovarius sp.]|uniref:hypothetical protein n=1 Tax=uncultured Roseovarius sp. TaxID=293344 RepID=UPI002607866C|nr:hypothetical protein [uncultured Roseovarius sp.]
MRASDLRAGAENLLLNCGGLTRGDQLLILQENPDQGYYDSSICDAVLRCAHDLDIHASVRTAPFDPMGGPISTALIEAMKAADRTLFLSRCGDQIRFSADMQGIRPIMSYALDTEMLASGFGRANYQGFVALKNATNEMLSKATEIQVTCPLGTNFSGPGAAFRQSGADVTVDRFPMLVFAPIPVAGFSGVIMQEGFLVGTGSKFYEPYGIALEHPIAVHFKEAALCDIDGDPRDVEAAKAHYRRVGGMFGLDPFTMHSWHAGIHPGCACKSTAAENFERWSGSAFGNPRLLHFHTCGDYAPGEISLNVLDPTISVDGVAVWSSGQFDPAKVPGGADILESYPCIKSVFDAPCREVGQGADGRLCGN